nr:hypothetical protein [uncultured Vibrio sp.]
MIIGRRALPYSVFRIPYSVFRIPYSVFRIPYSVFRIPVNPKFTFPTTPGKKIPL